MCGREKVQPHWMGYRAASKLHCDESSKDCDRPVPVAIEASPTPLIASDSHGKVLHDLAREVAAERERAVHASMV
jgi:hypothetical protein